MRLSDLQSKNIVSVSDGKNIGNIIDVKINEENGEKMESAPHPQQKLRVELDQSASVYDLLRKKAPDVLDRGLDTLL